MNNNKKHGKIESVCQIFIFFPPSFPPFTGYATHLVGKWHLGFYMWPYVPTKRGFDTAYGFWDGAEDHFDHTRDKVVDFRDNLKPVKDLNGTYAANAYVDVSKSCLFSVKLALVLNEANTASLDSV